MAIAVPTVADAKTKATGKVKHHKVVAVAKKPEPPKADPMLAYTAFWRAISDATTGAAAPPKAPAKKK